MARTTYQRPPAQPQLSLSVLLVLLFLAGLFAISPSSGLAQSTSQESAGQVTAEPDAISPSAPVQQQTPTKTASLAAAGDSSAGSIGGVKTLRAQR
jgi:hypothetical protein